MVDVVAGESLLATLEESVDALCRRVDVLRQENLNLRKQLQAQRLMSEQLAQKNSRASEAIGRVIASMEGVES